MMPNYQFNSPYYAPPNVNKNEIFGGFNSHCKNTAGKTTKDVLYFNLFRLYMTLVNC